MAYLEMARDEEHGGGTWAFGKCLWAPTKTVSGSKWPFWSKILDITEGDLVFHLRGVPPNANFVGYSIASGDGFEARSRPPNPGKWDHADYYYRANLKDFVSINPVLNLDEVFKQQASELESYFERNKERGSDKANIFYVRQGGRLQCLNGAYLSDMDDDLLSILFDTGRPPVSPDNRDGLRHVETHDLLTITRARRGQKQFADRIKELYGYRCCFPGCSITDRRFLVASHIARWSDNKELRGDLVNGLCLCLMHDKAFELGLFTLDDNFCVYVNPSEQNTNGFFAQELFPHRGKSISLADLRPSEKALSEHRDRVGLNPCEAVE